MNYEELKFVIRYIKRLVSCSKCNKKFLDRNISVLATFPTEGVFQLDCRHCDHTMIVNIGIQQEADSGRKITETDVHDMHHFLQKFNGDFKSLFKN